MLSTSTFARLKQFILRNRSTEILIYGKHSQDWMNALLPEAPVWKRMQSKKRVNVSFCGETLIPENADNKTKTIVIPLMEDHTSAFLDQRSKSHLSFTPDSYALGILRNKQKFSEYISRQHLSHLAPKDYKNIESIIFPCVLKRTDLNAGIGVSIANSLRHLEELLLRDPWHLNSVIFQELIPGEKDLVSHCLCKNGKIIWNRTYQYTLNKTNPIRGADCKITPVGLSKKHKKQIELFLAPLKYSGPCNIDFKVKDNGDLIVFEINPRLGGSLMRLENIQDLEDLLIQIIKHAH